MHLSGAHNLIKIWSACGQNEIFNTHNEVCILFRAIHIIVLVAQRLNHYATPGPTLPSFYNNIYVTL